MSVLPVPVGKHTRLLLLISLQAALNWYSRSVELSGYSQALRIDIKKHHSIEQRTLRVSLNAIIRSGNVEVALHFVSLTVTAYAAWSYRDIAKPCE